MTQILNRRTITAVPLLTLSNNIQIVLDDIYDGLTHKAFLFEYRFRGMLSTLDFSDWQTQDGTEVCLIRLGTSTLDTILSGAEITDVLEHEEVPERQKLFAIAKLSNWAFITGTQFVCDIELDFKPNSKGGIPFMENSGWLMVVINRTGSDLTTGNIISGSILERFAYEGGGR